MSAFQKYLASVLIGVVLFWMIVLAALLLKGIIGVMCSLGWTLAGLFFLTTLAGLWYFIMAEMGEM